MKKRQVLFVTYGNENITEGVSYAIELAKAMGEGIRILFVQRPANLSSKFEKLMTAVTFAEASEDNTPKQIMSENPQSPDEASHQELAAVLHKCRQEGVHVTVQTSPQDAIPGIRTCLKKQGDIDKVVLSPAITAASNISSRDIKRLVRVISRPVVTMAWQPFAVAGGTGKV